MLVSTVWLIDCVCCWPLLFVWLSVVITALPSSLSSLGRARPVGLVSPSLNLPVLYSMGPGKVIDCSASFDSGDSNVEMFALPGSLFLP